jgi:outer membrane biosynthesis protein TonB
MPRRKGRTRFLNTAWIGAAEIGTDGSVARVRAIQPFKVDPPWPELDASVVAAIRQWTYHPACVDGHPVKLELHVTVRIDFR